MASVMHYGLQQQQQQQAKGGGPPVPPGIPASTAAALAQLQHALSAGGRAASGGLPSLPPGSVPVHGMHAASMGGAASGGGGIGGAVLASAEGWAALNEELRDMVESCLAPLVKHFRQQVLVG